MCRNCFSPLILHSGFFQSEDGRAFGRGPVSPARGTFTAESVVDAIGAVTAHLPVEWPVECPVEYIFKGGKIIPVPGARPVDALAIGGGKILAVGSKEIKHSKLNHESATIIDLGKRVMMPGFIDPHNHTVLSAVVLEIFTDVGYENYPTREKVKDKLRELVKTEPGQWITCSNFDNLLQGGDLSRDELDKISTDRPIFVWYTNGHDACVNSKALEVADIPEDIGVLNPGGGHFGRYDTETAPFKKGDLNGLVYEDPAMQLFVDKFEEDEYLKKKFAPSKRLNAVIKYIKKVAAQGITTVHEPGTLRPDWIHQFAELSAHLDCRTSASLMYDDMAKGHNTNADIVNAIRQAFKQRTHPLFSLYGVKIVGDGSNQTESGAQTRPYLSSGDGDFSRGEPNYPREQLMEMVNNVQKAGQPVLIHANGDYTIDIALDAIEAAYGSSTKYGVNRIEHSTMARPDQILRMKRLNVQPSFLMNHVRLYGAAYRDQIFGEERTARTDPAGDCAKAGVPFTLHSDSPCSPVGSLALASTAVTRRCEIDGSTIGLDQSVMLDQALRAITIDAAKQIGLDARIGSLEAGKEADLVILGSDPYQVPPENLAAEIDIMETWVAGKRKYEKSASTNE